MDTVQKLSVPISIVIAGALIAGALFVVNNNPSNGGGGQVIGTVAKEIRGVEDNDHIVGKKDAEIVLVEFSDTECPFCKRFHDTLHQVMDTYGGDNKVAWVYRHFPLEQLHPKAAKQAEALECAAELGGNEGFWKYTDLLYKTTNSNNSLDIGVYNAPKEVPTGPDGKPYYTQKAPKSPTDAGQLTAFATSVGFDAKKFEECLASGRHAGRVETDLAEATAAGGGGTPHTIILVEDEQIPIEGALPFESIAGQTPGYKEIIGAILARGRGSAMDAVSEVYSKYR